MTDDEPEVIDGPEIDRPVTDDPEVIDGPETEVPAQRRSGAPASAATAEALAATCFLAAALAAIGLGVVYWQGGQTQLEGVLLAVCTGGIGVGIVVWAKRFMPHEQVAEERERLASSEEEIAEFRSDFEQGEQSLLGRRFLVESPCGVVHARHADELARELHHRRRVDVQVLPLGHPPDTTSTCRRGARSSVRGAAVRGAAGEVAVAGSCARLDGHAELVVCRGEAAARPSRGTCPPPVRFRGRDRGSGAGRTRTRCQRDHLPG